METKICNKCHEEHSLDSFSINDKARGYRRPDCKACVALRVGTKRKKETPDQRETRLAWHKNYYQTAYTPDQKKVWREANRRAYHSLREEVITNLGGICVACQNEDVDVLQVDHIHGGGGKLRKELGHTKTMRIIRDRLREKDSSVFNEVQILCANCHHKKTTRR